MKTQSGILATALVLILLLSCASEKVTYDLPSASSKEKPTWVGTHRSARDTIFIVVHIPNRNSGNIGSQVQEAQSALHGLLVSELDVILRDYWVQQGKTLTEDEEFQFMASLPKTLEAVMKHISVTDGWEAQDERAYLCAIDYMDASNEIMLDMNIDDVAFRSYLKRRMDELARKYK